MATSSKLHRISGIRRKANAIPKPGACPHLPGRGVRDLDIAKRWRITPGFSLIRMDAFRDPSRQDPSAETSAGDKPKYQFPLGSSFGLRRNLFRKDWGSDTSLYFVPGGRNLLRPVQAECGYTFELDRTLAERSAAGTLT